LKPSLTSFLQRPVRGFALLAFCFTCVLRLAGETAHSAYSAGEVEAVFLVNFCRFTNWPPKTFTSATEPITVAVWADEHLTALIVRAAKGERVGTHPIVVKRIENAADAEDAELVFVSESAELAFERNFDPNASHALLVGESPRFFSFGGHLQFASSGKIRVHANLSALKRSGLELSSNLLRICQTQ
jgi:hypothetical protein